VEANNSTPIQLVNYLNSLLVLDNTMMLNILESRVECNKLISEHPFVQVVINKETFKVGFLGIINGLIGNLGFSGKIIAEMIYVEESQSLEILCFKYISEE
jgi:hypothetical protein